jgi:C-terminal processing protease CtpA/Prc
MRKMVWSVAVAMLVAAGAAWAGGGEKCTQDAQACLNGMAKMKDRGWVGIQYDKTTAGALLVKAVTPNGPAATAGFETGDEILTINGANVSDKEAMKKAKGEWKVGQTITYTISRKGAEKTLTATLAPMPSEVFASIVGEHMVADHVVALASTEKPAEAKAADAKSASAEKK